MRDVTPPAVSAAEQRVLVLAPVGKDAELTRGTLTRAGIAADVAPTLEELCEHIREGAGAVIVAEEALPDRAIARLQSVVGAQPSWSDLPVLLLSGQGANSETVIASMHALGNVTVLERPLRIAALVSAVRAALRARQRQYQIREQLRERERAARALADTVESLNMAMEAGNMAAYSVDLATGQAVWTDGAFDMLGFPASAGGRVTVEAWTQAIHEEDRERVRAEHARAREARSRYQCEYRLVRPCDGRVLWIAVLGHFVQDAAGNPVRSIGIFYDFTPRKAIEDELRDMNARLGDLVEQRTTELRDLSHHLLAAIEHEKRTLARELHDELGSLLTAVNLDLGGLRRKLDGAAPDAKALLERAMKLVEASAHVKRRIMEGLRPSILDMMGLGQALGSLANEFVRRTGVQCHTSLDGSFEDIDQSAAIALYRIAQEALTNIAKYAAPQSVNVELSRADGCLRLAIEDDGIGLPDDAERQAGRHGIAGMRERVTAMGGKFVIARRTDAGGTRLAAEIPLH
jgi:signal transduction histidine kinase/FixJ family two-component response regulator